MGTIRPKRTNFKVRKFAEFKKKTINFKVMKTIRNQLKNPIVLQLPTIPKKGIRNSWYSIFDAVTKRTTNRQQTKNQLKLARNCFWKPYSRILAPKICPIAPSSNTDNVLWPLINENKQY